MTFPPYIQLLVSAECMAFYNDLQVSESVLSAGSVFCHLHLYDSCRVHRAETDLVLFTLLMPSASSFCCQETFNSVL